MHAVPGPATALSGRRRVVPGSAARLDPDEPTPTRLSVNLGRRGSVRPDQAPRGRLTRRTLLSYTDSLPE